MHLKHLFLIAWIALIAGCGGNAPAPTNPAAVGVDDLMVGGPKTGSQTTVAVVSPALTSQYHVQFVEGAVEEGESYGWKVQSLAGDRETNFAAQVDLVESAVRKGVEAMTICAINDKAIVGAIEKANEAGIPVFIHNSLTELEGVDIAGYTGFDQRKAGRLCGEYAVKILSEKNSDATSTVYIITGIPGFHSNERVAGFHEIIDQHPNIEVVGSGPGNWERLGGMNLAETALKANDQVDLIFAVSDAMAQGAAQAVQEAGKDTMTLGLDGNPDTLKDIQAGVVTASLAVFPKEMGKIAMQNIKNYLDGEAIERRNETPLKIIDASNVGEYLN
ncbi:MAG: sugar ABC transporter substrate-binding protein [Candidatus Omnitrophica bacterium]|nr:sugar ABC transporter substrate-binding protein [Candidatus Omnitrophota bacterium]